MARAKPKITSFNSNPVLKSLADITTGAMAGATLGSIVDKVTRNNDASGASVGALLGAVASALGQIRRI